MFEEFEQQRLMERRPFLGSRHAISVQFAALIAIIIAPELQSKYQLKVMKKLMFFSVFVLTAFMAVFLYVQPVYARQGCCSWHGGVDYCDTSVGIYVCNDGTYSPSCGCAYIAPTPTWTLPEPDATSAKASYTFSPNGNSCNQNVTVNWEGDTSSDRYSVSLTKVAGGDPGPQVDTSNKTFTFPNINSGKWYFNLKPGNKERWGKIWYWTAEVPKVDALLSTSIDAKANTLQLTTQCVKSLSIKPLGITKDNPTSETISLDLKEAITIEVVGRDIYGNTLSRSVKYEPYKEPTPTPTPLIKASSEPQGNLPLLIAGGVAGLTGFLYIFYRAINQKWPFHPKT